jgi:thiamine biosynthesis lipoprotein
MRKSFLWGSFFLLLLLTQCKDSKPISPVRREQFALDTVCQFTFYYKDDIKLEEKGFDELHHIESLFDRHDESSELGQMNLNKLEELSPELQELLDRAFYYADITEGLFNPAIGPLVDLWDVGSPDPLIPAPEDIDRVMAHIDWTKIHFKKGEPPKLPEGISLDLGGIAKGYAADRVRDVFAAEGVESAIINLGGNVLVMGRKPGGDLWKIGVQNPISFRGDYVGILKLDNLSMVTSGNYERFFEVDGVRYHHILDPRTGYPVSNGLSSVTIVTQNSTDADALSTSLYIMGLEKGMDFALEQDFFDVLFITENKQIYMTPGMKDYFELTDQDFTISNL